MLPPPEPAEDLVNGRFLAYLLGTQEFYEFANQVLAVGATNQTELNREVLGRVAFAVPGLAEQRRLVERLEVEAVALSALGHELTRQLELISERRSALVLAAVTGQLDIDGEAA
jgi:type I restriction enzyme S subunit